MAKNLIIGLGGTGGNIICELRKRIFEEYRSLEPNSKDVFIDYLYIDSSNEDLRGLDAEGKHVDKFRKKWQTMGESVQLTPAQTLFIGGLQKEKIDQLHKYNNLNGFFSEKDRDDTAQGLNGVIGAGIGGQRRRFGRMLFSNSNTIDPFEQRIKQSVDRVLKKGAEKGDKNSNITFHICAGLGGGTGSGTIVDVISLIRRNFPQDGQEHKYRICLYLYIPEALKNYDRDAQGFYRPNGYAALAELNALAVGNYKPIDITDVREISSEEKRIEGANFEAAYLYTDHNFADNQYNLSELPKIVADFLFQKLLVGISPRFEKNENAGLTPEEINGTPVHARNFMSFGIKRLVYPESEIHEYVSYRFAYTSAMQMVWGWPKNAVYPSEKTYEEINVSPNEIKGKDDHFQMRQTLHITDTRLMLDSVYFDRQAELAKKAQWRPIVDFWKNFADRIYTQVLNLDKSQRISKLNQEMSQQYMQYFRGNGVVAYYKNCANDKAIYADEVVSHIGNYLLTEWKEGRRSLAEVGKFLDILIEDCKDRFARYDDRLGEQEKYKVKYNQECNNLSTKFNNSGIVTGLLKDNKTFAQYKDCLVARYVSQTMIQAYEFAKILIGEITDRLIALRGQVKEFTDVMLLYIKNNEMLANEKCQDGDGGYNAEAEVVKLYEPSEVRKLVNQFEHEEEKQKANTDRLTAEICSKVDSEGTHFAGMAKAYKNVDNIDDVLNRQCRENAKTRLDDYAVENKNQKLLDTNILEKLRNEPDWEELLEKMCKDAMILIQQNTMQNVNVAANTRMIEFGLPKLPEDEAFRNKVIAKVSDYFEGGNYTIGEPYETAKNQLVILTGLTAIPIRYVLSVQTLKDEYDKFILNNVCNYKLIHTESFVDPLPSLYNKSQEELTKELRPLLLLAYNIKGILAVEKNSDTGEQIEAVAKKESAGKEYCYNREDRPDDTASSFVFFGKNVRESLLKLSKREGDVYLLDKLMRDQLKQKYQHNDKKRELVADIKRFIKDLLTNEFEDNTMNKEFQEFVKAGDMLADNELKEK